MAIKLNAESWHYKLFKKELPYTEPPRTLCPYFWILVGLCIATPFLAIGRGIDSITTKTASLIPKNPKVEKSAEEWLKEWDEKDRRRAIKLDRMEKIGKFFGKVFMYGIVPICLILLLYGMFTEFQKIGWYNSLIGVGVCILIALFIVGFFHLIGFLFERYSTKVGNAIVKFSIFIFTPIKWIGWMIKAGYEKACPLVEWEGDVYKERKREYNQFD
jgi:hypothetical protein